MTPMETRPHRRGFPAAMFMPEQRRGGVRGGIGGRRNGGGGGDRSPINPVIVLRGGADSGSQSGNSFTSTGNGGESGGGGGRGFELYYDDGAGSGLRPLLPSMSEFPLGSGSCSSMPRPIQSSRRVRCLPSRLKSLSWTAISALSKIGARRISTTVLSENGKGGGRRLYHIPR
ncbi:unnamed protein product [Linum trigynum]|uniref:Uncharacterized protein n=1 Tax=Linum trigynum TaxID=586398 RepID=A0AAV2F550_9ROSI